MIWDCFGIGRRLRKETRCGKCPLLGKEKEKKRGKRTFWKMIFQNFLWMRIVLKERGNGLRRAMKRKIMFFYFAHLR